MFDGENVSVMVGVVFVLMMCVFDDVWVWIKFEIWDIVG